MLQSPGGAKDHVMQVAGKAPDSNRLTTYIMVSLLLGIAVGYACNTLASPEQAKLIAGYFAIVSDIFLRMIKKIGRAHV